MYNQIIIDRLRNLSNLYTLKKANVKIVSKKNEFGDIVKFFAQINTENVIQKISYKASGCTTFVALCSYFCELVEGKSIEKACKINEDDLKSFCDLDEQKTHVYKIILDTFALLIKKYQKGIQNGKIVPCEVIENSHNSQKTNKVKQTKISHEKKVVEKDLEDILTDDKPKKKKIIVLNTNEKISKNSDKEEFVSTTTIVKTEIIEKNSENNIEPKKSNKNEKIEIKEIEVEKVNPNKEKKISAEKKSNKKKSSEEEIQDDLIQNDKNPENSNQKLTHLQALNQKIQSKENNDKQKTNTSNLNSILNKLNTQKEDNIKKQEIHSQEQIIKETKSNSDSIVNEQKNSLSSIRNSLSNLKKSSSQTKEKSENIEKNIYHCKIKIWQKKSESKKLNPSDFFTLNSLSKQ